jgi:ParB/RepB/Spo0J family partition protein
MSFGEKVSKEKARFELIPVSKIHKSSILPPRNHGPEVAQSVRNSGIEQPLIVRPLTEKAGEYELIDGLARLDASKQEDLVLVDVRTEVKESDVFRISERTFQRTDRSAYEKAQFYKKWGKALEKEKGDDKGMQAILAQEAGLSESLISQYWAIYGLFDKLDSLAPSEEFNALKSWSVNKLYDLSELIECENLLKVAREFERRGEVALEEVQRVVVQNRMSNQMLALLDDHQKECVLPERGRLLAEEVNSLATETHQMLTGLVEEMLEKVQQLSSTEILMVFDKVLQTLKRLRRRTNTLRQIMNKHEQSSSTQTSFQKGEK